MICGNTHFFSAFDIEFEELAWNQQSLLQHREFPPAS